MRISQKNLKFLSESEARLVKSLSLCCVPNIQFAAFERQFDFAPSSQTPLGSAWLRIHSNNIHPPNHSTRSRRWCIHYGCSFDVPLQRNSRFQTSVASEHYYYYWRCCCWFAGVECFAVTSAAESLTADSFDVAGS